MKISSSFLSECTIECSTLTVTVVAEDGEKRNVKLKDPEDFLNDLVPEGKLINLVFDNWKIFTGLFSSIEDNDGEITIYIKAKATSSYLYALPYKRIVGYYLGRFYNTKNHDTGKD